MVEILLNGVLNRMSKLRGKKGVAMIEYALLAALIALALVGVITAMRGQLGTVFDRIRTALT